jgi:hypothetical protein
VTCLLQRGDRSGRGVRIVKCVFWGWPVPLSHLRKKFWEKDVLCISNVINNFSFIYFKLPKYIRSNKIIIEKLGNMDGCYFFIFSVLSHLICLGQEKLYRWIIDWPKWFVFWECVTHWLSSIVLIIEKNIYFSHI